MNQPEKFPSPFRLGPWLVRPDLNRIEGVDGAVQIEPTGHAGAAVSGGKSGRVLTRLELLDLVWGDTVVGEEILTRAVSELRRVFGDSARQPQYIETIRNHGYRLIAAVEPVAEESVKENSAIPLWICLAGGSAPHSASATSRPSAVFSLAPGAAVVVCRSGCPGNRRFWPRAGGFITPPCGPWRPRCP